MTQEELLNTAINALNRVNNTFDSIRNDFHRKTVAKSFSYEEQREILLNDLKGKLQRNDMHGVMDCAADIRVLDAANGK